MQEKTILIKNSDYIVTMNKDREILKNSSILIKGNKILECPTSATSADEIIDASGKIVYPGFINLHHHFFQTSFRFVPEMQNAPLDKWVKILGKYTKNANKEDWYNPAMTSLVELVLSGCTSTLNHSYLIPNNNNEFFDEEIKAAKKIGMRFHNVRGSMTLSSKDGTIFPPDMCQSLDVVLQEINRVFKEYHDDSFDSMCRIGAGPCFPIFPVSSSEIELKKVLEFCRKNKIRLHTHLAEEIDEFNYSKKNLNKTPVEYLRDINALGPDVSLAHCIFLTDKDIQIIKESNTSIVSCPSANSRGAGIAKITEYLNTGINVAVGVDGAAGNDTSNILSELRMLRTLQGAREGVLNSYLINHDNSVKKIFSKDFQGISYLNIDKLLEITTLNGAKALGRENEIGSLENGKLADIVIFDDNTISHAGSVNRIGSLFSCNPIRVWYSIINGEIIVRDKKLVFIDEQEVIDNQKITTEKLLRIE